MKKKCITFMFLMVCIFCTNKAYGAISDKFKFVIDTVGVPRYNSYGEEINEEVYYTYNVFSYSKPQSITSKSQRWKNSKYGFWTKNGGSYKGTGVRGEYYILGKSYSGSVIYNYYFPMDVIPSTTPDKWTFYKYPEAKSSWSDKSKYKYAEQLEHMKYSKLMFNDISSRSKADNPKYIKEYNITANKIGLNKARLDTCATWKTYGMISTRRKIDGVIYSQVYLVKPMAANAEVKANLTVEDNYVLKESEDELLIPISYNLNVENMTGYAKKEHIKNMNCKLYINGEKVDEVSGSKITSVGNKYMLVITRDKFPPQKTHNVELEVNGYMHTEFAVDGLMQDKLTKKITICVEDKPQNPIKNINVMTLEKNNDDWVVRPLAQTNTTKSANSVGFSEGGKYIALKLEKQIDINKPIKEVIVDGKSIDYTVCMENSKSIIIKIKLSENIETTLYGIDSLRDKTSNYFKINENEITLRQKSPHEIKIISKNNNKEFEDVIRFDTMDNIMSNINTKLGNNILNISDMNQCIKLEEWFNE